MLGCVIFNPAARGERARRFRHFLSEIGSRAELKPTLGPGSARVLAREAVEAGHQTIIAAGGDGTVFEVLNGIADAPQGLSHAALGVLPLGTANVLAHELRIPMEPAKAWAALRQGRPAQIDCGYAEFLDASHRPQRAYFSIVAGAGLDARAVQLVDWQLKRRAGKLAYIAAALRAWARFPDRVRCVMAGKPFTGRVVLAGNGQLYAGDIPIFGDGSLASGRLHLRGVEEVSLPILWSSFWAYLTGRWGLDKTLPADSVQEVRLESDGPVPLQLDGEFVGWLPALLRIIPGGVRVVRPGISAED